VVFGKLVGEAMAADLRERKSPDSSSVEDACRVEEERVRGIIQKDGGASLFAVLDELKTVMSGKFGLFREQEQMASGLLEILALKEKASDVSIGDKGKIFNQALVRFLELEGMLPLAEVVARGALGREESRGSHARTDFPVRDDVRFLAHTVARLHEGKVALEYRPVQPGMFPLQERGY
jgi:succinate dehydrogenase / fumarate reductase flavoprotein subunit